MTGGRAKILLQGDSLTQLCWEGWGAHLANVYQRRADVINRGYGGYNTKFYLQLPVDETLVAKGRGNDDDNDGDDDKVILTTLFFGANDQALPGLDDHKHVPVPEFKANLKALIDQARTQYQCSQILILGPPPVHHGQRLEYQIQRYGKEGATGKLERTMETAQTYSVACSEVATEEGLPFLDVYHGMLEEAGEDGYGKYFTDGLHFSAAGHDYLGKAVVRAIAQAYPQLQVHPDPKTGQFCNSASQCQGLPNHGGPFHDEIDAKDLEGSFRNNKVAVATSKKRKDPPGG